MVGSLSRKTRAGDGVGDSQDSEVLEAREVGLGDERQVVTVQVAGNKGRGQRQVRGQEGGRGGMCVRAERDLVLSRLKGGGERVDVVVWGAWKSDLHIYSLLETWKKKISK